MFLGHNSSGRSGRGIEAQVVELEEIDSAPSWQGWNQQGFDLISWGAAAQNSFFTALGHFCVLKYKKKLFASPVPFCAPESHIHT